MTLIEIIKKIKTIEVIKYIVLIIPIIFGVGFAFKYGVNTLFMDDWSVLGWYDAAMQNGLSLDNLLAQHNEHRLLFPKLILLASMFLSHGNIIVDIYIIQFLLACTYLGVVFWVTNFLKRKGWISIFTCVLFGLLLYNIVQIENLLWGFQVGFYLLLACVFYSILCFDLYIKNLKLRYVVFACIFGFVASFSSFQGLFVWLMYIVIFLLFWIFKNKIDLKAIAITITSGIVAWVIYMLNFVPTEANLGDGISIQEVIYYLAVTVGNVVHYINAVFEKILPSFYLTITAIIGGIVLLLVISLVIYILVNKDIKKYFLPLGMLIFGCGIAASIVLGRADRHGVGAALTMRYPTFTLIIVEGLLLLIYVIYINRKSLAEDIIKIVDIFENKTFLQNKKTMWVFVTAILVLLIVILICLQNCAFIIVGNDYLDSRTIGQNAVINYETTDLCIIQPYVFAWWYSDSDVNNAIDKLKKYNLNVYYNGNYNQHIIY